MLIIETGSGVRNANSYVSTLYVTDYLTNRNRQTENSWASASTGVKESACIQATDYLEKRFSSSFKGYKKYAFVSIPAKAQVDFATLPEDGDTLTVGDEAYTFVSSLTGDMNDILIGLDSSATIDNFIDCLSNNEPTKEVTHGAVLDINRHVTIIKQSNKAILTAVSEGIGGNSTILTTTSNTLQITSFSGGVNGGPQPLSFPRSNAFYNTGIEIEGVPEDIKKAVCEYAVRVLLSPLLSDPVIDSSGMVSKKLEKIGPIETEVAYAGGTYGTAIFTPYPAADELLRPYLNSTQGRVIRG